MIPVYLCEDDMYQLSFLKNVIENEILINELDMTVVSVCASPYRLLDQLDKRTLKNAVYFLDLELGCEMDGFRLAQEIRKRDPRAFIIFITTHDEMLILTFHYRVEALDFIIKDAFDFRRRIALCLSSVMEKYEAPENSAMDTLPVVSGKRTIILQKEDIYFIESILQSHKVAIHTADEVVETITTLKDISEKLDERFVQCHQAFIINCKHVISLSKKNYTVMFENGLTCPCSTRQYSHVFKKLNPKERNLAKAMENPNSPSL